MSFIIDANARRYVVDRSFNPTVRTPYGTEVISPPKLPDARGLLRPIHRLAVATFTRLARERAFPAHFIEVGLQRLEQGRSSYALLIQDAWELGQKSSR